MPIINFKEEIENAWKVTARSQFCGDCRYFGFARGGPEKVCKNPARISLISDDEFNDGCELWETVEAFGEIRGRIANLDEVDAVLFPDRLKRIDGVNGWALK